MLILLPIGNLDTIDTELTVNKLAEWKNQM